MKTAKIIGATGYGGVGILELLLAHPEVKPISLVATQDVGKPIHEVYPHLTGFCSLPVLAADAEQAKAPADIVFFATPDGVGMLGAEAELKRGAQVVDYSGDFRFNTLEAYADYATRLGKDPAHKAPHLLKEAVYGLPELHRSEIHPGRKLVGNVGCFAIGCIIGLSPAMKRRIVNPKSVICDCKSGVSGAGKKMAPGFHYPARQDNMNAYRLTGHQHVCEVERELSLIGGRPVVITFTAQVVPANRGILACLYADLEDGISPDDVESIYRDFYKDSYFVRLCHRDSGVGTQHVRGSNFCNLIVDVDKRTRRLRVISHIDNLMKGQAGNALQNMNLLLGLPEQTGLDRPGQYP